MLHIVANIKETLVSKGALEGVGRRPIGSAQHPNNAT